MDRPLESNQLNYWRASKFSMDIETAHERGDLEDGTTLFGLSPLDPISRKPDHDVIVIETGKLRELIEMSLTSATTSLALTASSSTCG